MTTRRGIPADSIPFIVDAHLHTGYPNIFFSPEVDAKSILARMDQFAVQYAINLCSMRSILEGSIDEMEARQREFESSGGRLFYCGFYDPRRREEDIAVLEKASRWKGMKGIKIHPSFAKIPADDKRYERVWEFAAAHDLPIVAHTWSVSSYNPAQVLSTPDRFEPMVRKFPTVRFVLGHSAGRGDGRRQAVRMAGQYANVFMDCSGDIYDLHYFEGMAAAKLDRKVLFGTDFPWMDFRSHLGRVYLASISKEAKRMILRDNALAVFRLEG
jgi:predicted TIM-barrel fold metal-dependent hydrolase